MKTKDKMSEQTRRDVVAYAIKCLRKAYAENNGVIVTNYYHRIASYWQLDYVSVSCYKRAFQMYYNRGLV